MASTYNTRLGRRFPARYHKRADPWHSRVMRAHFFSGFAFVVTLAAGGGCRHRHSEDDGWQEMLRKSCAATMDPRNRYYLGYDDPNRRKDAAEKLRADGGPPADAVPYLIEVLSRETAPDVKEEMLITLGASGAPDARPVLDAHLHDPDRQGRKGAEKGLERWSNKTRIGQLQSPDADERREAAEELGEHGGPPPEAVGPLLAAARREQDQKTLESMLLTLGGSGAPEAKAVIEPFEYFGQAHFEDANFDNAAIGRTARRALKRWQIKNGERVRRDVEIAAPIPAPVPTTNAAPQAPPPPDGCGQFKEICAADPFSVEKCRSELKPMSFPQQQFWADCVNELQDPCQQAHDRCVVKAKKSK